MQRDVRNVQREARNKKRVYKGFVTQGLFEEG